MSNMGDGDKLPEIHTTSPKSEELRQDEDDSKLGSKMTKFSAVDQFYDPLLHVRRE